MVQMSGTGDHLPIGTLKFNAVAHNDAHAYDPVTGMFTAPWNGVYTFAFQVFTHQPETSMFDIKLNGNIVSRYVVAVVVMLWCC
jgi:hypothetical protein